MTSARHATRRPRLAARVALAILLVIAAAAIAAAGTGVVVAQAVTHTL